ncbi:MAG: hypothetical protein ACIAXF_08460 [Phycisphaerales bacterium JB063]
MEWAIAISLTIVFVVGVCLMRAAQPAKARAAVRRARCPVCNGLGFEQGALTKAAADSPTMCTAKCQLCGERVRFDRQGKPIAS